MHYLHLLRPLEVRLRDELRPEQIKIAGLMKDRDARLIVSGMGSGKTGAALTALRDMLDRFEVQHVLIVAPWFVAANTWPDEIEAWEHTRPLSVAVAVGTEEERIAAVARRAEITTINFENLVWLAKHLGTAENWFWDCVVIDESSRMKSGEGRTKTTKIKSLVDAWTVVDVERNQPVGGEDRKFLDEQDALDWIKEQMQVDLTTVFGTIKGKTTVTKVRKGGNMTRFGVMTTSRRKINRIYELTGTPTPQGPIDLWGQIYLLDQGTRLGRSKSQFEERHFIRNQYSHELKIKEGAEEEILSRIGDIMVTIPKRKLTEDAIFVPMRVDLPSKAMREYRELEETMYSEPYDVEAVTNGVLANKLLQFANGHLYREDRSVVAVHQAKFDALDELVTQSAGENLLVFYSFKFDKDALKARYPHAVVANEDSESIRKWNKGKIKMLLAHPASIGHGTNLQHGGHLAAWFGLTFSLEYWLQANMRLPRPGQTEQVFIYPIIARGTYDERAIEVLNEKDATQERIVKHFLG